MTHNQYLADRLREKIRNQLIEGTSVILKRSQVTPINHRFPHWIPEKRQKREKAEKNYLLKLFVKTKRLIDDHLKGRNHTNRNARQNEIRFKGEKVSLPGKEQEKSLVIDDVWTKQAEEAKASWGAAIRQSNLFTGHSR